MPTIQPENTITNASNPVLITGYLSPGEHNSRREWCRCNIGPEHQRWHHTWTTKGYAWHFASTEDRVMFQLVWCR